MLDCDGNGNGNGNGTRVWAESSTLGAARVTIVAGPSCGTNGVSTGSQSCPLVDAGDAWKAEEVGDSVLGILFDRLQD